MNLENDPIISELARRVEKPKFAGPTNNRHLNFRCPLCGDSEKNANKRRGYIYQKDGGVWFTCFNCSTNLSLKNFLKETNPDLFNRLLVEELKLKKLRKGEKTTREDVVESIEGLIPLKTLPNDHPAFQYVLSRKIPKEKYQFIYYGDHLKEKLQCAFDEGIVFTTSNDLFVARNIDKTSNYRYHIKKVKDEAVFGLEYINFKTPIYITEGIIDSFFLPNCIPALGPNLQGVGEILGKDKVTLVWDNEPRNREICHKIHRAIRGGFRVVIFPPSVNNLKDLNEMILKGYDVASIVKQNNFIGPTALLKYNLWKRIRDDDHRY